MLTTTNHSRDSAGLTYVYAVISRRSGGLSVGINLNPNNACNWGCVYCQVPDLQRGCAPEVDLLLLEEELRGFLKDVLHGDFYLRFEVPPEQRVIRDVAISGNGEPTSSPQFDQVVDLIGTVAWEFGLCEGLVKHKADGSPSSQPSHAEGGVHIADSAASRFQGEAKLVLISNGSLARRETVQQGLRRWADWGGEAWFKLDSATREGLFRINGVHLSPESVVRNLDAAANACPTWLQTCLFAFDGQLPSREERKAYLDFLWQATSLKIPLRGVLLYGLARPSMQSGAPRLSALPAQWMEAFAEEIRACGLQTRLSL